MLGNFTYYTPTKLYFGENALEGLQGELEKFGENILLIYGGGSIRKNGIYDDVTAVLKAAGKNVKEISGVMPNPTMDKVYEGLEIARAFGPDLLLAVGGGSVCDYAKMLAVSIHCDEDPWERYFVRYDEPDCEVVPVGCVLTMVGTGSEMNSGAVITNLETMLKLGHEFDHPDALPRFSILNPRYTMSVPYYQMVSGIYDIFNHICEQYFSGEDDNTSDYISEGLMRSVIVSSRAAIADPQDYEARSNLMWCATWALNTLISRGKATDWMVHKFGQAAGAFTDAAHGMLLAAVSLPYYRRIMADGLPRFVRFAKAVWEVDTAGKSDTEIAEAGLAAMESWMKEMGLVMRLRDLNATEDMIEGISNGTPILNGGYRELTREEVLDILRESM